MMWSKHGSITLCQCFFFPTGSKESVRKMDNNIDGAKCSLEFLFGDAEDSRLVQKSPGDTITKFTATDSMEQFRSSNYHPATFKCMPSLTQLNQMNFSWSGFCRAAWHVDEGIHSQDCSIVALEAGTWPHLVNIDSTQKYCMHPKGKWNAIMTC